MNDCFSEIKHRNISKELNLLRKITIINQKTNERP